MIQKPKVLTGGKIARAIFEEDCRLHDISPEQAEANPDILSPDGVVVDIIPDDVALRAYNRAICKAQRDDTYKQTLKAVARELGKYKVLMQPREGYITLMIPDKDWQALLQEEVNE